MQIATHVLSGHVTEVIDDDAGQPELITYCPVKGAQVTLDARIMRPLLNWLSRPGNSWLRKAPSNNSGVVLEHELRGVGFDGPYETKSQAYVTFTWSIQDFHLFLAEVGKTEDSFDELLHALVDATEAWAELGTPPTHLILDAQDW